MRTPHHLYKTHTISNRETAIGEHSTIKNNTTIELLKKINLIWLTVRFHFLGFSQIHVTFLWLTGQIFKLYTTPSQPTAGPVPDSAKCSPLSWWSATSACLAAGLSEKKRWKNVRQFRTLPWKIRAFTERDYRKQSDHLRSWRWSHCSGTKVQTLCLDFPSSATEVSWPRTWSCNLQVCHMNKKTNRKCNVKDLSAKPFQDYNVLSLLGEKTFSLLQSPRCVWLTVGYRAGGRGWEVRWNFGGHPYSPASSSAPPGTSFAPERQK